MITVHSRSDKINAGNHPATSHLSLVAVLVAGFVAGAIGAFLVHRRTSPGAIRVRFDNRSDRAQCAARMPDDAATFETHLARLHPDVAGAFRHLRGDLQDLLSSVHKLVQRIGSMDLNLDRTIAAARKLENAADAVVKVLNDTVSNQQQISTQLSDAQSQLQDTHTQLSEALERLSSLSGNKANVADQRDQIITDLQTRLDAAQTQISAMGTAAASLDQLSQELEDKASTIGKAVEANTAADPTRAAATGATGAPLAPTGAGPGGAPGDVGVDQARAGNPADRPLRPGERIPGSGQPNLPPGTASNEQTQENLGNPNQSAALGNPTNLNPAGSSGQATGVPTAATDQSSKVEPEVPPAAPPVPPAV